MHDPDTNPLKDNQRQPRKPGSFTCARAARRAEVKDPGLRG